MNQVALVTGGAGFIGSHIVDALLDQGMRVRVLDNLSTGSLNNLSHRRGEIEFIEGDLRDKDVCYRACEGVETVFHQAALPSVPRSIADPITSNAVNVDGTLQMLMAARDQGARRFVFASSSSVYGNTQVSPKHEGLTPCPLSPYAINKLTGEHYCKVFHSLYGLETVCLRYFNVFGPRQDPNSQYSAVIPKFVAAALNGDAVIVNGDGGHSRDFTFVQNVVQANLLASWVPGVGGSVFNVGCGTTHTLNDLCWGIEAHTGRPLRIEYGPEREGDVRHSMADIAAARERLRYDPAISFQEGLKRTVRWTMRENELRLDGLNRMVAASAR
jgi:UDP-N-acetylglucosamine/UDP-N-acetyl-alpha-D-glucosaminouronate 4-epimerase